MCQPESVSFTVSDRPSSLEIDMHYMFSFICVLLLFPRLSHAQSTGTPPAGGSTTISEACADSAFRAFDFWLGRWVVRDSTGTEVGTSRITRVASGCGIREEWTGTSGYRGTSLNYYDPGEGTWRQDWVGSDGLILHLSGGLEGEGMLLTGERSGDDGLVIDRIRWRELPDGRVRQEWTTSTDGGATWRRVFLGFYEAAPDSSGP
jgi:hypothetical protein